MNERHLTYQDKSIIKWNNVLKTAIAVCWIGFFVMTVMDVDIAYDLLSIAISLLCVILYINSKGIIGKYWIMAKWFCIGTFIWFLSDVLWFLVGHILPENEILSFISDNSYLIPDYMFMIGLVLYARDRFDKINFQILFIDAFIIAIVTFIVSQSYFVKINGYRMVIDPQSATTLLYSFVTLFILVSIVLICIKTGFRRHVLPFFIVAIALMVFDLLEVRFTFYMFMNKDPENPYLDVLFLLCIICYAVGFSDVRLRDADFSKDEIENQLKSSTTRRFSIIYWINMVLMIAGTIILYLVHFFDASTVYYMITTSLAYVIMCKTIQGNMLAEELIARQKDENARLEHMVEEKTKELKDMNEHLEYISNTDVLTGLYNRRYGVDLLDRFIKDSDAYPVTLFSLDLNHFKPINDNYGHDVGDVVLQEVGKRLSGLGQDRCTPIRIGGDEFLLIFRNSNQTAIENMASLICKRMDEPIEATVVNEEHGEMHHTLHVSACIGIATFPTDAIDVETLYKMADEALYSIKHKYENSVYQQYSKL